ncbi:hypothetical protein E2986_13079 [Frieseomelitta varia]|uniref:Uncharacterized protein n=1 Tax=Frieseomelitta varia TaxID=561572 RepID=A0A833RXV9_9HYME|nr:hypothetical protein E2986_13079 [Frieseomelitta varia]
MYISCYMTINVIVFMLSFYHHYWRVEGHSSTKQVIVIKSRVASSHRVKNEVPVTNLFGYNLGSKMWCLVSQANSVILEVQVDPKAIGQECLEKVVRKVSFVLFMNNGCAIFYVLHHVVELYTIHSDLLSSFITLKAAQCHPFKTSEIC